MLCLLGKKTERLTIVFRGKHLTRRFFPCKNLTRAIQLNMGGSMSRVFEYPNATVIVKGNGQVARVSQEVLRALFGEFEEKPRTKKRTYKKRAKKLN